MKTDTIAAISTAMQPAGIAVIRLSGPDAINIADKIYKGKRPLTEAFSHSVNFGYIYHKGKKLDEVLILRMDGPSTYTGEDTVEINCHGSLLIQKNILSALIESGARMANPGEFTMRAFMNGKLDLAQAESVMDLIMSESELALNNSFRQLSGQYSDIISSTRDSIRHDVAFIEAALDDPDSISLDGYSDSLSQNLSQWRNQLQRLIETYNFSGLVQNGIDTAIIGRTNVGKSSLLNAVCGQDAAIVSNIPGTTRDSISKTVTMGSLKLNIIDTAGLRSSTDEIESIGIKKSLKYMDEADLILYVVDSSQPLSREDEENIINLSDRNAIILLNKSDLPPAFDLGKISSMTGLPIISISAKTLDGIGSLSNILEDKYLKGQIQDTSTHLVTNERHLRLLKEAANSLALVEGALQSDMGEDIYTIDLMDAYTSLGKILGQEVEDDIINEIFSKFCVGK